jgi:hypothetical protein
MQIYFLNLIESDNVLRFVSEDVVIFGDLSDRDIVEFKYLSTSIDNNTTT